MEKSLAIKIIAILFYALFAISILLAVVFALNMNEELLIGWAYALAIGSAGVTLAFALVNMFKTKKAIITSLGIIAGFGVLVGISYSLASDVIPTNAAGEVIEDVTAAASRWSGAALYTLYTLLGLSFVSLIYTEIRGAFK